MMSSTELLALASRGFSVTTIWPEVRAAERVRRAAADRRHEAVDVRILPDDVRDLVLVLDELVVRRALRRLGRDRDLIGVLIGDEALRHDDEEQDDGQHQHDADATIVAGRCRRTTCSVRS